MTPQDELKKAQVHGVGILLDEYSKDENDVPTSDAVPESCIIDEMNKDENDDSKITCAYIGVGEDAWDDPYQSAGGCNLS
ncbi:hypothetical protein E8E12_004534 [Didymella heteroderae]|uniref:Uncharacterized protein n=1 Tax=Didymella heteroderae TaxID=1769908 RepID=A0A9P5BX79_9PLEO|nr:hypothetical protein E8E12_004534 [Didymella heteroderae]